MNCRRRKGAGNPNAHKRKDPSKAGNGKKGYDDKHGMERHTGFRGDLEVKGGAKVVKD